MTDASANAPSTTDDADAALERARDEFEKAVAARVRAGPSTYSKTYTMWNTRAEMQLDGTNETQLHTRIFNAYLKSNTRKAGYFSIGNDLRAVRTRRDKGVAVGLWKFHLTAPSEEAMDAALKEMDTRDGWKATVDLGAFQQVPMSTTLLITGEVRFAALLPPLADAGLGSRLSYVTRVPGAGEEGPSAMLALDMGRVEAVFHALPAYTKDADGTRCLHVDSADLIAEPAVRTMSDTMVLWMAGTWTRWDTEEGGALSRWLAAVFDVSEDDIRWNTKSAVEAHFIHRGRRASGAAKLCRWGAQGLHGTDEAH